jgi:hypothetical protein
MYLSAVHSFKRRRLFSGWSEALLLGALEAKFLAREVCPLAILLKGKKLTVPMFQQFRDGK